MFLTDYIFNKHVLMCVKAIKTNKLKWFCVLKIKARRYRSDDKKQQNINY